MISLVLRDLILESSKPSVNAPFEAIQMKFLTSFFQFSQTASVASFSRQIWE
jgi:hypothetical protein